MKVITAMSIIPLHILRVDSQYQGMRSHPQLDKLRKNGIFENLLQSS